MYCRRTALPVFAVEGAERNLFDLWVVAPDGSTAQVTRESFK